MKILRKITSNSFFKNVASLMTGSGISQIIAIISIPILTSLYSPNEFGEYATYIAVISILAILASGRYELAIMLPKSRIDSIQIFYLTQIINIFFLILFSIVLVFIDLPHVIEEKQTNMKILICSSIFVLVLNQSLIYLANKFNYFSAMSLSRILNSFFTAIFSMLLYKYGINGMLLGFIIGNILSALNIVNKIGREFLFFKISYIIRLLKEYQDFPKKNILSALMNVCSTQVPVILITTFFGASISGYYTVALRFLNAPITFIGKAFSQVYFNKFSNMENYKKYKFYKKSTIGLFAFITPTLAFVFVFANDITNLFLGNEWSGSAIILQYLIPFYIVRFVFSSQSPILITEKAFSFDLKFNLVNAILQILVVYTVYILEWQQKSLFLLMSLTGILLYLYLGYKMATILKGNYYEEINEQNYKSNSIYK